jgi:neuropeptide Y receptor
MLFFPALVPVEPRGVFVFNTCVENPRLHYERVALAYSLASTVFQYLLPISIVLFAYASICNKLRRRFLIRRWSRAHRDVAPASVGVISQIPTNRNRRQQHRQIRVQRTYALLVVMTVTFVISWLPLNIVNIVADVDHALLSPSINNHAYLQPFCHLMVLVSAVVNPLLYGWLNENFHREFVDLWHSLGGVHAPRPLSRDHSPCHSAPELLAPSPTHYNEVIALDEIIVISNVDFK